MRWPWSRRTTTTFDTTPRPIDLMIRDMLAASGTSVSRADALSVPSVRRGRNMLCAIATMPLEQLGPDYTVQPSALLAQLDPDVPNVVTLSQTVEDLLLSSIAWWLITAKDFAGFPVSVRRLDPSQVSTVPPAGRNPSPLPSGVDPRGVVWVDGQEVGASRIIRFDSPNPAVLSHAGREINRAILLDKAAGMYADDPRPLDFFMPADGADPADDDDIEQILAQWKAARKSRSTGYVPAALKYETVDAPSPQQLQLVELSRQVNLDIANSLGVDPEDLGISTTSRTYANDVDRRRNRLNEVLKPYMAAIEHRLSMGDVTRRGYTVRFDTTEYLMPNPAERWQIYSSPRGQKVITDDEVRELEGMPPMPAGAEQEAPVVEPTPEVTPIGGTEADAPPAHTFDSGVDFTLDIPVTEFSVDKENRIIEGLAVPYGQTGTKDGLTFRFDRGSLQWTLDDPGRVKLVFPRHGEAVGKAIQLKDTPKGLFSRFKVGRGAEGDRALMAAEDGVFDGLSIGVDFDAQVDAVPDPRNRGAMLVRRADLRHVALTPEPVFANARVTHVAASRTQGGPVADEVTVEPEAPAPDPTPAPVSATFSLEQVQALLSQASAPVSTIVDTTTVEASQERPAVVNPTRRLDLSVTEALPYQFDRGGNFVPGQTHTFSADLHEMAMANDVYGNVTDAGKRVMGLLGATFSTVVTTDINELNPNIQRPDMYVDQQDFKYPIWNAISKGAPPNGVQPFTFPKFSSASGLVGDHTEGTEPTAGTFVTTSQTVTPTAISGKASITREVWDMGGNPAVSTLIFNQMVRGWREGLESAAATFLNTLTAATDINLGVAVQDEALAAAWDRAVADLNFVRGYDFTTFVIEQQLYRAFVDATAADGRKIYPQQGPTNTTGTSNSRFTQLDLAGVTGLPSWALTATDGAANNSWLFDPMFVHGWATTPQRLEFPGTAAAGTYAPVAMVDLAIWGYKALANSDVGAVRQVIYDNA